MGVITHQTRQRQATPRAVRSLHILRPTTQHTDPDLISCLLFCFPRSTQVLWKLKPQFSRFHVPKIVRGISDTDDVKIQQSIVKTPLLSTLKEIQFSGKGDGAGGGW